MKAYPTYKDSGVDWLKEVPQHWEIRRFSNELSERRVKVSDQDYPPISVTKLGIVPQLENVAKTDNGDNRKLVRVGDFVINSRSDRKGSSGISSYEGSVSLINHVLIPATVWNRDFIHHLLRSVPFQEEFYKKGHGIVADLWTTRYTDIASSYIPFPPVEEQTAIVAYLDKKCAEIEELISRRQSIIVKLRELKQSIIAEAVTKGLHPDVPMKNSGIEWLGDVPKHWKILRLKNVASVITDTLSEKTNPDFEFDYVDISSVTQEQGIIKTERFKFTNAPSRARRKVQAGDIIISTVRTYLRAIAVISKENENIIASTGFAVVRSKQFSYVAYVMRSHSFVSMVSTMSTGVSYPAITSNKLLRIHMAFPPEEEQQAIVAYLDKKCAEIDELISRHERTIEKLKELKTSTIAHVVTGKVDVRDAI